MSLPEELQEAISQEAEKFKLRDLSVAREDLTARYRQSKIKPQSFIGNELEGCAYIIARMPATYAVIGRVLGELLARVPSPEIFSMLDLGAGPGTAMWAASQHLPSIEKFTLIEKDTALAGLGQRLARNSKLQPINSARWHLQRMEDLKDVPKHDLVLLSYSAGELPSEAIKPLIEACWQLTNRYLVVVEPGSPVGFELIRSIRSQLLEQNARLVAPCPQEGACPMQGGNWCHFSERIQRSFLHRRIKSGTLGYEDEKFSYIIASKDPCPLPEARVVRHPQKHSGHVTLELCSQDGLKQQIISKRTPELYKLARKLEWGSTL